MRLLFIADGRSPIALNWIRYFVEQGHEVHLVSTFACDPGLPLASLNIVPVALSSLKTMPRGGGNAGQNKRPALGATTVGLRTALRQLLGPLTLPRAAYQLRKIIERLQPELIHAMRIPYEGMLAAQALEKLSSASPLLISVWGNDFTLHAPSTPLMGRYTWRTLTQAAALHADCARDVRLGRAWGFDAEKPTIVLPGGGGVQMDLFYPADEGTGSANPLTVINPRGFRAYVRNDTFFRAIPLVLARSPGVRFLCPAMLDVPQARRWVSALGNAASDAKEMADCIELLPRQSRPQMASLFRQAQVVVSPSIHDGTPNTLLEALACGCFPVVGDLESLREWITPGINGLMVDPSDPGALAEAIMEGLSNIELRKHASVQNLHMIATRAEYIHVMEAARAFYAQILTTSQAPK